MAAKAVIAAFVRCQQLQGFMSTDDGVELQGIFLRRPPNAQPDQLRTVAPQLLRDIIPTGQL